MNIKDIKVKEEQYRDYIKEHIDNVIKIWKAFAKQTTEMFYDNYVYCNVDKIIEQHDQSKYGDKEFDSYRRYFFPVKDSEKSKELFKLAWNNHQKTNPHHWQYWIMWSPEGSVALKMEWEYVIEMLCDWTAMSLKFNNKVSEWYRENKCKMLLHNDTIDFIEAKLPEFDRVLESLAPVSSCDLTPVSTDKQT